MSSPALEAHAARDVPEARIRELALAKVKTNKAYVAVLYRNTKGLTDEQLVDLELELVAARKAMNEASIAFERAI